MLAQHRYQTAHAGVCQPYQTQLYTAKSDTYASTEKVISHQLKAATTEFTFCIAGPFHPAWSTDNVIQWGQS